MEATGEAIASLDTSDIYKDLAVAKEEANGFATVLSKLGEGENQFVNLHDAVMDTAREIAEVYGITDASAIGKIGEKLLEGLYDTYPEIINYVDTATGLLTEGWEDGIAKATNPWAEFFKKARLEDALTQAKRDMAALDVSSLWDELLNPEGKGLYQYADDWARALIPDGTEEEVHSLAQQFVDAFFDMFSDIDTSIMDGNGRIAAGMEATIAIMRKAANAATTETTKLQNAYKSLHSDTLARNEAIAGLTNMKGMAETGNTAGISAAFEALSAEAISAIADAMPELIDRLNSGTAAAEDFEAAIGKLHEAEVKSGRDAWKGYFDKTAEGLKQQSALFSTTMKSIIAKLYEMREAAQSMGLADMADSLREERVSNAAGTGGYQEQVDALTAAFGEGGTEGVTAAMEVWNSFDASLQQSIAKTYPSLVIALDEANRAAAELSGTVGELEGSEGELSGATNSASKRVTALGKA